VTLAVRASGRTFLVHCNVTPQAESLGAARANHTSHGAPDFRANIFPEKTEEIPQGMRLIVNFENW
jgi:hypothetical protein